MVKTRSFVLRKKIGELEHTKNIEELVLLSVKPLYETVEG